ncbi:MAG: hypothetical protein AAF571_01975 [Verrucomicrobiota bacterium]
MPAFSKSALIGAIVGFAWFVIQFLAAEGVYQLANLYMFPSDVNDNLYEVSDAIAFPAGIIYDALDASITETELERFTQDTSLDPEVLRTAESLLSRFQSPEDLEALVEETYEFLSNHDIYAEVPISIEYSIYVGTCLVWGFIVGIATTIFVLTMFSLASHESRIPPIKHQDPTA